MTRCWKRRGSTARIWPGIPFALLLLLAAAGAASAQSLEITSTEPGLPVLFIGNKEFSTSTPLTLPQGQKPYYAIRVGGRDFERRDANLEWDSKGNPRFVNHNVRRSLLGTAFPGAGSYLSGRRFYGAVELAGFLYFLGQSFIVAADANDAAHNYESAYEAYEAETDVDTKLQLGLVTANAYDSWQTMENQRRTQVGVTFLYWGVVAAESWWLNRPLLATQQGARLQLSVPKVSVTKSFIYSLLFPGMGQAYKFQRRAPVYTALEVFFLERSISTWYRFQENDAHFNNQFEFDNRDGISPEERDGLDQIWSSRQNAKAEFLSYMALAGGVWIFNVVDAIVSQPKQTLPPERATLSLARSPSGGTGLAWVTKF